MPTIDLDQWEEFQEHPIKIDKDGGIIDFIDNDVRRANSPEERTRQRMAQIIHFELGYPKEVIAIEKAINIGKEKKRADIIIYYDEQSKINNDQGKINLIGEFKSPNIKEPDNQLLSYISATSASGGFWTNGNNITFYKKDVITREIHLWIGIPKHGHTWDSIGKFKKHELIEPIDLKTIFRRCHNALYRSGIDSEDVALDMVRIILAKVEDESSSSEDCLFHITSEEFRDIKLKKGACDRVRKLFEDIKDRFPDVFTKHEEISVSDEQLSIAISYIQQYSFLNAPYDVIGTAYEVYVASHLKGERGQYFTNRLVINMMVRMLDPSDKDIILDPACGSAGFLIASMNYIFKNIDSSKRVLSAKDLLKRNVCHNLFGIDTTPKLVKVAKANMLLSRDGHTGIIRGNSLGKLENLPINFIQLAGKEKLL